jgi:hypothetical protein
MKWLSVWYKPSKIVWMFGQQAPLYWTQTLNARMIELCIVNEIKDGVNFCLRLFIDYCITSLKKLSVEVF